ncbi:winged helix DNA-binding domain-containing protein [Dactylosporangium vinaceum]|uniref:DNA glycosylase AlkZ-like family protein n=1 Tax=Dactylosporangium vinaceum TaxID=53362 RepID=A0ABV5LZQ1_9ACTN|nr:crosslink repair DNA glycosylase YcaQ family protein [Dactylosporangium vinaceum]UAB94715.1 winged helix DNA-binding domain-containing protein [Dactylosporangium vinaceum]
MTKSPAVCRAQVLAYRTVANDLHERHDGDPTGLAVLALGVPNVPAGSARQALAARCTDPRGGDLTLAWSTRGAPHLHRPADLPDLAGALWPLSDADAAARYATGQLPKAAAELGLAAFSATAAALREVVRRPTAKGEVSRAVSDLVPPELTYDCKPCGARHISGGLLQLAGLGGGVRLEEDAAKTVLAPIAPRPKQPAKASGTAEFIKVYLRLLGPATPGDVAKYLGTTVSAVKPVWPEDLAAVSVDGKTAWLPAEDLDGLLAAAPVEGVRLLPPSDPFLQARDRSVLVPDKAQAKEVWRMLGNPGVLLVDGDIAGTWRARAVHQRLEVSVTPWTSVSAASVQREAETVAAVRGLGSVEVRL